MRRAETDPLKVAPPSIPPLQGVRRVPVGRNQVSCKMVVHFFVNGGLRGGRRFEMGVSCMMVGREV